MMRFLITLVFLCFSFAYAENYRSYSGSMAINPKTGITGSANNFSTETEAIKNSIAFCNKKNRMKSGCVRIVSFNNGCGATAWSSSLQIANGEVAEDNKQVAEEYALKKCRARGANDCKIVQSFCTNWETTPETYFYWW